MASVKSPIRTIVKPILFKLLGKRGYRWAQYYAKKRDIDNRLVEEEEMALLPLLVSRGDEVLDIGANYAYYTERLSRLVPEGHVYAFEPIPFTYEVAGMLVKKYDLKNVSLYRKGVGEKTETLKFSVPKQGFGSISAGQAHMANRNDDIIKGSEYYLSAGKAQFDCEVVDIDSFLLPGLKKLSFVKMDIEGAEYFALKGMERTLDRFRPVILIEIVPPFLHAFGIELAFFQQYIEQTLGYRIFEYNKSSGQLVEAGSVQKPANYILVHESKLSDYSHLIA
jgi:FkbM family methyltransferase